MSAVNQQEILASFKLLVSMAKADGKLLEEERANLVEAFSEVPLPEGTTVEGLLSEAVDIDELLKQITSETAQELAYQSAYAMAYVDGECCPEEQELIEKIGKAFANSRIWGKQEWLKGLQRKSHKTSIAKQVQQISDPNKREIEVDNEITDSCFFNAVIGAFPLPGVAIAFDMLVYFNQMELVQTIGERWGYDRGHQGEDLRKALFGSMGMTGARIAISNLAKVVPVFGIVVGATTAFASTWAIGKTANRYFASGCTMDVFSLREAFKAAKKEGEAVYKSKAEEIAAKQKAIEPQVQALSDDLAAGRITQEEYEQQLKALV